MYTKFFLTATLSSLLVSASPTPASVNQPITDAEMQALVDGGLKVRSPNPAEVNQPITDEEMQALIDGGLKVRSLAKAVNAPITARELEALNAGGLLNNTNSLAARDKVMNCGHLVTGSGGSDGHGKWIPVDKFQQQADEFCRAYVGSEIYLDHQTSDTHPTTLTNQDDDTLPGPSGNVVFAIYHTEGENTYNVDHDTCLRAMLAPLGDHVSKRDGVIGRRDNCYGTKHNDYEGGYYKIDNVGAFGSEVYAV
ncbi:hypothetical protein F5Y08DRAFT_350703 [Xylaria arbuscula]|nr:hypothetical protein F5Y08DRAFT_350703 [Xylaria arbuscula]